MSDAWYPDFTSDPLVLWICNLMADTVPHETHHLATNNPNFAKMLYHTPQWTAEAPCMYSTLTWDQVVMWSDLLWEGQGVGTALVVDGDEALLNIDVGGAIFSHGA